MNKSTDFWTIWYKHSFATSSVSTEIYFLCYKNSKTELGEKEENETRHHSLTHPVCVFEKSKQTRQTCVSDDSDTATSHQQNIRREAPLFCQNHPSKSCLGFFFYYHPFTPWRNLEGQPLSAFSFFANDCLRKNPFKNTRKKRKFLGTNSVTGVLRAIRRREKSWRFYYSLPPIKTYYVEKKERLEKMSFLVRAKVVLFKSHFLVCYGSLAEVIGDSGGLQEATSLFHASSTPAPHTSTLC